MSSSLFVNSAGSNAASSSAGASGAGAGAAGAGGGSTNLAIHPLPILNMSEHHTRTRLQKNSSSSSDVSVYGILLGTQQGRDVELHNSFEFILTNSSTQSNPVVDHHLLKVRQDQFKQVFPTFEIMGWYSSGPDPNEHDMAIHRQLLAYNETLIFLKLSPSHLEPQQSASDTSSGAAESSRRRGDDDLPLYAYETVIEVAGAEKNGTFNSASKGKGSDSDAGAGGADVNEDSMNVRWAPCGYRIETGEAERIAVDHASKPPESGTGEETSLIANLSTQYNAVKMLSDRVKAVAQYVALVQSGAFPRDHETLRQVRALVSSLPVVGMPELSGEIVEEYNDVLLTSYLSNITQQVTSLNELVDKFDLVQEPSGGGGGGPGLAALGAGGRRLPRMALGGTGGGGRGGEPSAGFSPGSPFFERSMGLGGSSSNAMSY
ncbi:hypothetical protein OC846_002920 [Tilletia horrida]|uniref:COP9 signalosome complex subunit 6 n=1 Tax=Tilletia horrida TaxID=155126 RepID=A0AAN6GQZ9_9BASI|nr:hypothetical protein OC846_002920 [Tilletia horrida]